MNIYFEISRLIWKIFMFYKMSILHKKHYLRNIYEISFPTLNYKIQVLPAYLDNYSYLLISGRYAILIDPPDAESIYNDIDNKKLNLEYILITHHHPDHDSGVLKYKKRYGSKIIAPKNHRIPSVDITAYDGMILNYHNMIIKVISTPGHTSSHMVYHINDSILFSGDLIFPFDYGGIFHERDESILLSSLKKLRKLSDSTMVFYGHENGLYNYRVAKKIDNQNRFIDSLINENKTKLKNKIPSVPIPLYQLKMCNPFLKWDDQRLKDVINVKDNSDAVTFHILRKYKHEIIKDKQVNLY